MKKPRPSASAIADADIKPYLAAVLLEGKSANTVGKALASQLLDKMRDAITDSDRSKRALIGSSPVSRHGALHVGRLIYRERASPAWLRTDALCDETYHLAVVAVSGNAVALICSRIVQCATLCWHRWYQRSAINTRSLGHELRMPLLVLRRRPFG